MKTNKKGFTLVELVIVIAVIAILAAVLIPTFSGIIARANANAAKQRAVAVRDEILGKYYNSIEDMDGLIIVIDKADKNYVFLFDVKAEDDQMIAMTDEQFADMVDAGDIGEPQPGLLNTIYGDDPDMSEDNFGSDIVYIGMTTINRD